MRTRFLSACFLCLLLSAFLTPCTASAADAIGKGGEIKLSLMEALRVALKHNEDVKESFNRVAASEADALASRGPYDLNVFSTYSMGRFSRLTTADYPYENNAARSYTRMDTGLRQRVPTGGTVSTYYTHSDERMLGYAGGRRRLYKDYVTVEFVQSLLRGFGDVAERGAIATALLTVQDSREARNIIVSQVVLDVVRAYWELELLGKSLTISKQCLNMAEEVLRRENVRFAQGLSQGVDVDRATVAVKQREYTILQYERDIKVAQERLMLLLNHPDYRPGMSIRVTSTPKDSLTKLPRLEDSQKTATSNRYELKQLAILLKQLDIEYDINTNKLLPNLDLSGGITTSNAVDQLRAAENFKDTDDKWSWYTGVTFSFPLENREARGARQKTEQLMNIANERVSKTSRTVQSEVRDTIHNLSLAMDGIPVAKSAYVSAVQTMQGEMKRFEMLQANNRDLLASQDSVAREEINYYRAVIDYNVALSAYSYACGKLLERYGVRVSDEDVQIK